MRTQKEQPQNYHILDFQATTKSGVTYHCCSIPVYKEGEHFVLGECLYDICPLIKQIKRGRISKAPNCPILEERLDGK